MAALVRAARRADEWKHAPRFGAKVWWNPLIDTIDAAIAGSTAAAAWLVAASAPPLLLPMHPMPAEKIAGWLRDPDAARRAAIHTARARRDRIRVELQHDRFMWGPIERDIAGLPPAISARLADAVAADEIGRLTADTIRKARERVERARSRGPWPGLFWVEEDAPHLGPIVRHGRFEPRL